MPNNSNVYTCEHPLIQYTISVLRNKETPPPVFRAAIKNLARYMVYEIASDLAVDPYAVETPMGDAVGYKLRCQHIILAPILRAGLCMIDGAIEVLPDAQVRHIGLYRDHETLKPVEYYVKIPAVLPDDTIVFIVDPMLATGGSAMAAVDIFKRRQVRDIRFLCLIASPEGIQRLHETHPDVKIYTTAVDERLNDIGYIIPGLGDAGDRAFGTI